MCIAFTKKVSIPPDVLVQELAGESVLLNLDGGRYFGLDAMGTRFWQRLTASESIQAAYEALLAEYDDAEPDLVRRDLDELLEKLVKHGLVTFAGD